MDASYKIQRGIHVHLIQFFMCPEFWVHITSRKLRFPAFLFPPPAPEIHAGVFDKWGLAEQLFQGSAFFFREPLIFELERFAEQLCELLHPVPRRLHGLLDFPDQIVGGRSRWSAFAVILMGFANVLQNGVHVLCVTWQKKSSSCICPASKIFR